MAEIWDEFDSKYDTDKLASNVEDNKSDGDFPTIPTGDYEVKLTKAELKKTKKGNPMVSIWFEIIAGDYKKQKLFYNQVISQDQEKAHYGIHNANEFMKSLKTGADVKFVDFKSWNDVILDVAEYAQNKEYHLAYENVENGFDKFEIKEILSDKGDDGIPF